VPIKKLNRENAIEIYKAKDGSKAIEVNFNKDTAWLQQDQMVNLFQRDQSVISRHIRNVFKESELDEKSNMQKMHIANSAKPVAFYSLDVIISVGYRVKSKEGTQFRQWATQHLKDYLVKGYSINEQRLRTSEEKLNDLRQSLKLLENVVKKKELTGDEALGLLKVVTEYSQALDILDQYDHQTLSISESEEKKINKLIYSEAIEQIRFWREKQKAGKLFGNEKDQSFKSSLATIYQTIGGDDVYPSVKEKAANLLYFVVKNHSFTDGNKRIAAGLFVFFLDKNKKLYHNDGSKIIADNALVAITIMIAESKPVEKDMMIKLIVNLMKSN
jgi:prophage maintenance system killer protein